MIDAEQITHICKCPEAQSTIIGDLNLIRTWKCPECGSKWSFHCGVVGNGIVLAKPKWWKDKGPSWSWKRKVKKKARRLLND